MNDTVRYPAWWEMVVVFYVSFSVTYAVLAAVG